MSSRAFALFAALLALVIVAAAADYNPVTAPFSVHQEEDEAEATPEASASDDSDSDEVCVDATYLSKFAAHDLVHASHIRAVALCPAGSTLPCATPDHLVRVDGKPMSYRQLCATAKCESRRIDVNSVLSHVWKEEAHGNVHLTMYDARHPEFAQRVLHRMIAAGRAVSRRFA